MANRSAFCEIPACRPSPSLVARLADNTARMIELSLSSGEFKLALSASNGVFTQGYFVPDKEALDLLAKGMPNFHIPFRWKNTPQAILEAMSKENATSECVTYLRAFSRYMVGGSPSGNKEVPVYSRGTAIKTKILNAGGSSALSLPFLSLLSDMIPAAFIPKLGSVSTNSRDAAWTHVAQHLLQENALLIVDAEPVVVSDYFRNFVKQLVASLGDTDVPPIFRAILEDRETIRITPMVFGTKRPDLLDAAFNLDFGVGEFERSPGVLYEQIQHLSASEKEFLDTLTHLYTMEEATALGQFAFSVDNMPGISMTAVAPFGKPETDTNTSHLIRMGKSLIDGTTRVESMVHFRSHLACFGRPEMGKTTFLVHYASEARSHGASVLFFDVVKSQLSKFVKAAGGNVYDFGLNPIRCNGWIAEKHESFDQRLTVIRDIFSAAFATNDIGRDEWDNLLSQYCCAHFAEQLDRQVQPVEFHLIMGQDFLDNPALIPSLDAFLAFGKAFFSDGKASSTWEANRKSYFLSKLQALSRSRLRYLFDPKQTEPCGVFDEELAAINLEDVNDPTALRAIMLALTCFLRERRKSQDKDGMKPFHITIIDEAHSLIPPAASVPNGSVFISGQSELAAAICNLLREIRSYGESICVADQSPSEIDEAVLRTCGVFVCFALREGRDKERIREALGYSASQIEFLSSLRKGQAIVAIQSFTPYAAEFPVPDICKQL